MRCNALAVLVIVLVDASGQVVVNALSTERSIISRRCLLQGSATFTVSSIAEILPVIAKEKDEEEQQKQINKNSLIVPSTKPVVVLGAAGGTGRECVNAILAAGRACVATTRSGDFEFVAADGAEANASLLKVGVADVTAVDSLNAAINSGGGKDGIGAVIFAASASARGGDAKAVDQEGVINAARCCIANEVPRLVVVSSGTVTRPDSAVYKLLNVVGKGIMEAKIRGEDIVRQLYADRDVIRRGIGYTIIRPGGLTTGPLVGPGDLELNQGDDKSGRLSRADVAALCVKCLDSPDAFDTTFECYQANTAKPVETVGLSNILKSTDPTAYRSGRERRGETWDQLFRGLSRDNGILV